MFDTFLRFYHDKEVVQFFRYSWPISFYGELDLCPDILICNHQGARNHMQAIHSYITKELKNGSAMGPFQESPFISQVKISPLSTHEKKTAWTDG